MRLSPLTKKKIRRFRSIGRGYWSLVILLGLFALTLVGELLVNNKALVVRLRGAGASLFSLGIYTGGFRADYLFEAVTGS
jgi:microcin C transport system permease protein